MSKSAKEHKKDLLDKQCDTIFEILDSLSIEKSEEKIKLLEQCIDYLHIDIAYREGNKKK